MKVTAISGEMQNHSRLLERLRQALEERDFSLTVIFPTLSLQRSFRQMLLRTGHGGYGGIELCLFEGFTERVREIFHLKNQTISSLEADFLLEKILTKLRDLQQLPYLSRVPFNLRYRQALADGITEWRRSSLLPDFFTKWAAEKGSREQELALIYEQYQKVFESAGYCDTCYTVNELQDLQLQGYELPGKKPTVILYGFSDLTAQQQDLLKALAPWFELETIIDPTVIEKFQEFTRKYFEYSRIIPSESIKVPDTSLTYLQQHLWQTAENSQSTDSSLTLIQAAGNRQIAAIAREISRLSADDKYTFEDFLIISPDPQNLIGEASPIFEKYGLKFSRQRFLLRETVVVQRFLQYAESKTEMPFAASREEYFNLTAAWFKKYSESLQLEPSEEEEDFRRKLAIKQTIEQISAVIEHILKLPHILSDLQRKVTLSEFLDFFNETISDEEYFVREPFNDGIKVIPPREARGLRARVVFLCGLEQGVFPRHYINDWKLTKENRFELKQLGIDLENGENYQIQEQLSFYWALQVPSEHLYFVYRDQDEGGRPINESPFLQDVLAIFPDLKDESHRLFYPLERQLCSQFDSCYAAEERRHLWVNDSLSDISRVSETERLIYHTLAQKSEFSELKEAIYYWLKRQETALGCDFHDNAEIMAIIREKFGADKIISVTAIEDYLRCPYQFLLKYVLGVRSLREESDLPEASDCGTVLHAILQEFMNKYGLNGLDATKNDSEYRQFLEAACERGFEKWRASLTENISQRTLTDMIVRAKIDLLNWLDSEYDWDLKLRKQFRFKEAEYAFGTRDSSNPPLSMEGDGINVLLSGRIDRFDVDTFGNFLVYDYKSGATPTLTELRELKKVQIPLYLMALQRNMPELKQPVGGFYVGLHSVTRTYVLNNNYTDFPARLKNALSQEAWNEWFGEVKDLVLAVVGNIRNGIFNCNEIKCPSYCDYVSCCRREERAVSKDEL